MMDDLLGQIIDHYRNSADFNGLRFMGEHEEDRVAAAALVRDGVVQVVTEADFPNPSIRPWPSKGTIEQQVESITALDGNGYGVCLYPTPQALSKPGTRRAYRGQPYRQAMAKGRGALELAYFRFDVLEQYRNDPRFAFEFADFGATAVIGDDAFQDETEPEHDKIVMSHMGFAYDLSQYEAVDPNSPIVRRVCAFYGDLAKLSPTHQQRWKTYEVDANGLYPHPGWWEPQMGHWADGIGPFEKFLFEQQMLNEFYEKAHGVALFGTVDERPREFGWILRPSQHEWDGFILLLDKLLSENLRSDGLDAAHAARQNEDGHHLGSLSRLQAMLTQRQIPAEAVKEVLAPFREIRNARQRPAHSLRTNITDRTFVHRQVELIGRVNESLELLRRFWQRHPANRDWEEPEFAAIDARKYRF
jgi:hypothetical protein